MCKSLRGGGGRPLVALFGNASALLGLSRLGLSRLLRLVNDVGRNFKALFGRTGGDIACRLENFGQAPLEIAAEYLLGTLHDFARLRYRLVRDIAGL